jgi:hypothetical protein
LPAGDPSPRGSPAAGPAQHAFGGEPDTGSACERFDEALEAAKNAIDSNPNFPDGHATLAVAAAHLGRDSEALTRLRTLRGRYRD